MSFIAKKDVFGIAEEGKIVVKSTNDSASTNTLEIVGEKGAIVYTHVYGETTAPTAECAIKAKVTKDNGDIALGKVTGSEGKKYALANFVISTGAGTEPTISASGNQVNDDAVTGCKFDLPQFVVEALYHAQILFAAFEYSGEGVHLTAATYTGSCNVVKTEKDGVCLTFDVTNGKIEAALTFRQCGAAAPTVTPASGWKMTSPLSCSNPDADMPTWTCTLTRALAKTEAEDAAEA